MAKQPKSVEALAHDEASGKNIRTGDWLAAIQYERALVYEALGQHGRTREEFGRITFESGASRSKMS